MPVTLRNAFVYDANPIHKVPREGLANQKLSLFVFLHDRVPKIGCGDGVPVQLIELRQIP
jgi:hypothetical protein